MQMKHRALVEIAGLQILDHQCAGRQRAGHRSRRQRMRGGRARAGLFGPDRGEMAFSGAFRADQQHDAVRPVGPALDQRQARFIGRPFQKIVAGQALCVRQREGKLTGLNAGCHYLASIVLMCRTHSTR